MTVIYLQTTEMKHAGEDYSEVMMLDATYATNNRKMLLLSVMVVNGHGTGQVVAQALVCNEKRETILTFLDVCRENNPATEFMAYYMWVDFHRKKHLHIGNKTTNWLESYHQGSLTTQHESGRVHHPVDEVAPWQEIRNGPFRISGSCYGQVLPW